MRRLALVLPIMLVACQGNGPAGRTAAKETPSQAATEGNSAPFGSCYALTGFELPAPAPQHELFVVIDQTTGFDPRLVDSIRSNIARYLGNGPAKVTVASFSANTVGKFATIEFGGEAERGVAPSQRNSVNARKLVELDRCLAEENGALVRRASDAVSRIASQTSGNFANSEILSSLTQISEAVRQSPAEEKIVLLASDMLEHSSTASFYANRTIRLFDIRKALQKAAERRQLGDFGGARVLVIGAGLLPPEAEAEATRDSAAMANLRDFWESWFQSSNARLTDFGQPDLLVGL